MNSNAEYADYFIESISTKLLKYIQKRTKMLI